MASSPFPGSQPYSTTLPMGFGGGTYSSWTSAAAKELYDNIYNSGGNIGMPASWYAMGFKDPSPNDIIAGKGLSATLWYNIQTYTQSSASATDADFVDFLGMGQRPAPTENEFVPTAAQSAADRAATALGLDVRKQQFAEAKFAIEMAASQGGSRSSGGSTASRSSGGSSGGGGGGSSAVDYAAKLGYAQSAGELELDFARQKMQMELDFLKQKYAMASDPNSIENQHWQAQFDEQKRQHDSTLSYQAQRDQRQEQLARAETTAKLGANPGDAVQRELFLRTGKEPVGTPQSVWTGQPTGGAPTTLSQLMTRLTGQGVFGQPPALPPGTPTTVPYNTDPMNQPPPLPSTPTEPPPPAFAFGTQRPRSEITPDGWTRAQEFISGDPQVPSRPNPERVQLRVVNGEPQAKVTPLSSPPPPRANAQAFAHANSNARFMSPPPPRGMRPPPPKYAYGTIPAYAYGSIWDNPQLNGTYTGGGGSTSVTSSVGSPSGEAYVGTSSATQSDIDRARAYDARQAVLGTPQAYFYGMDGTDIINNPNSYQYGMTVNAAKAMDAAPLNNNAWSYDKAGNSYPVYDTTMMTQAEQDAYNIGQLDQSRLAGGVTVNGETTQSLYPSMRNYVRPSTLPALPTAGNQAGTATTAPTATAAPQQPAQQAYWGSQALNPGLQTIANSPFVPYASIGNPANVQIMDAATGQYRALRPGEDIPAGATVGVLNPVGTTGTGGTPSGATGAPGAATASSSPQSPPLSATNEVVIGGVPMRAAVMGASDAHGNAVVVGDGFVKTPDGGGWYRLQKGDYRQPDGTYIRYNPVYKEYIPVQASVTWISSMSQFYQLPPNVQQDILQGKPTGYMLNDRGMNTAVMSKMIQDERQRIASERGVSVQSLPPDATLQFEQQYFGGLEPGRNYPGGWVSSLLAPQFPTSRMLTPEEFRALPVSDQRALIDGNAGPQFSNNLASQGVQGFGSERANAATTGPMGYMPTGLFTMPQGEATSRAFDYGKYVESEDDARRIFPEYFQTPSEPQRPWYTSPFVKLKTGADGQVYGNQNGQWLNVATNEVTPWTTIPGGYDGPTPKPIPTEAEFNDMLGYQGNEKVTPTPGAYQAYVGMYKAQYPGVFDPITPATPAATPSTNSSQPPGPPAPGMKWVWVPG